MAPWVDRVKLRHGMDWLDLITNEVERDTQRINLSLARRTESATDVRESSKSHIRSSDKLLLNRPGLTNKRR